MDQQTQPVSRDPTAVPDKPTVDGLEERWAQVWQEQGTYLFDRTKTREQVFSIDTPPPTVSGTLHVGHVFSYTHTDVDRPLSADARPRGLLPDGLGRQRAAHRAPGAADLRRAVRPVAALRPRLRPAGEAGPEEAGAGLAAQLRRALRALVRARPSRLYESLWRRLGLSVDWTQKYTTISAESIAAAQRAFLRNLARGEAYQAEAPGLWDVTFQTAVAQAELQAREYPGHFHRIAFHCERRRGRGLHRDDPTRADPGRAWPWSPTPTTSATRPCSARRCARRCSTWRSRCWPTTLAEPDKGAGIAMVCTFGDLTDVIWWRELQLPVRSVVGRDGRLLP